jgi:hypothetical protein
VEVVLVVAGSTGFEELVQSDQVTSTDELVVAAFTGIDLVVVVAVVLPSTGVSAVVVFQSTQVSRATF